jgi:hypothetical protein
MQIRSVVNIALISGALLFSSPAVLAATFSCKASPKWVTDPNAPAEVPLGKKADFCEFYQFSWQWFLQLTSPATTDKSVRRFEVAADYPTLEGGGQNSCDAKVTGPKLFLSLNKVAGGSSIPERTGQAGTGGKGIYDQAGNVVFYDVRFSKNLCDVGAIQSKPNFPSGTTEMKTAWKQLTASDDASSYFVMEADIDGVPGLEKLGLIGFHLAIATDLHPEMIWSSYEHISNSPECNNAAMADQSWSFASAACIKDPSSCTLNTAVKVDGINKHAPTEICTSHLGGTQSGDPHYDKNATALNDLNIQINAFLSELAPDSPMAVWKNYKNVGALWVSDITQPSNDPVTGAVIVANQRGSLRMANTVMETDYQNGFKGAAAPQAYSSNCFGCHNYTVDPNYRNTGPHANFDVSHIFINDIMAGQCQNPTDVAAGAIFSDKDAQAKCAQTCAKKGGWNGNWTTTEQGVMSVCACCDAK